MNLFSFIFAGTSEFALNCLKLLLQLEALKLKGVISQPDALKGRGMKKQSSTVKLFAQKHNFPIWTPKTSPEEDVLRAISQKKCDFSFVCSYGKILTPAYLQIFPKGCINLHTSLLPRWRGAAPVQRALMAGDQETGICLQLMSEELDAGDIIGYRKFQIAEEDNAQDIFNKSLETTKDLLEKELIDYLYGRQKAVPQDHQKKSYAKKIEKKEGQIIWDKESAFKIHNKIRGLFLGPQAFSFFKGKRIKIHRAKVSKKNFTNFKPGEVCEATKNELAIACKEGALYLLEIQKEGRKRQKIEDFLKGSSIKLRDSFS